MVKNNSSRLRASKSSLSLRSRTSAQTFVSEAEQREAAATEREASALERERMANTRVAELEAQIAAIKARQYGERYHAVTGGLVPTEEEPGLWWQKVLMREQIEREMALRLPENRRTQQIASAEREGGHLQSETAFQYENTPLRTETETLPKDTQVNEADTETRGEVFDPTGQQSKSLFEIYQKNEGKQKPEDRVDKALSGEGKLTQFQSLELEQELGQKKQEWKLEAERILQMYQPIKEAGKDEQLNPQMREKAEADALEENTRIEVFDSLFNKYHKAQDKTGKVCWEHAASRNLEEPSRIRRKYSRADRNSPVEPTKTVQQSSSLFEKYQELGLQQPWQAPKQSLITKGLAKAENSLKSPKEYTKPFCDFLTENPTVFHTVVAFEKKLESAGFKKLSERQSWTQALKTGGKYFVSRNGSSLIAFTIGSKYAPGNGVAMIAGHIDALTVKLKPVSTKKNVAGYVQLGVAPYAGASNPTWWDRDLGIGGRVVVKDAEGKIKTKVVKLDWPIAKIPTLAPHFGEGMMGQNNPETQAVPIIGLDNTPDSLDASSFANLTLGSEGTFAATQPPKLVRAISKELGISDYPSIINWELELYDTQPAQTGGLEKEFIFAGRIDDKLCSWAAIEALLISASNTSPDDGIIKLVGVFDNEEIGSLTRQGARGNFLPSTIERVVEAFGKDSDIISQTYANSFLISADVWHAVNPNFISSYLENHSPRLNVGVAIAADSNGHVTTDSVSTALLTRIAEKCGSKLQTFMIRNDSRSGNTVGPMLAAKMGCRSIDAGIPQLSMHSVRATTGSEDPGLGVRLFRGFLDGFEGVDGEFE